MATVTDATKSTGYNPQAMSYGANNMYTNPYSRGTSYGGMNQNTNADIAALAHTFQGMNLQSPAFTSHAKTARLPSAAGNYTGFTAPPIPPGLYGSNGGYVYPTEYNAPVPTQTSNIYTPHAGHYMPQMAYPAYQQHDNSPLSQNWTPTTGATTTTEVPTLITPRRDSISSNENDQPATPSYPGYPAFMPASVAVNRSPSAVFSHSTPSPTSIVGPYGITMPKQPEPSDISPRVKLLVTREPAIPRAIPAPSSPLKPLDRALENQRGETNVYIRGLHPETTDKMLEAWGLRFGDIKSSKSIIDMATGLCKGFGFVKYHNYEDAENCIRGFHYLGYEVSFARESFYSKLKTFSDPNNTNLYVSNLPKSMNEHELSQLFAPHKVCSSRILRDKNGNGRGVGFARFDSNETCEEVIRNFNNQTIKSGDEDLQIQIRYADTHEQKSLKQQTLAARQFRSAEYEYATQAWRQARFSHAGSPLHDSSQTNEFDQYLGTTANVPIQSQRWAQPGICPFPERLNTNSLPYTPAAHQGAARPLLQVSAGLDNEAKTSKTSKTEDSAIEAEQSTIPPTAPDLNSDVHPAAASEQK